jgi:uncharacterized protein involved in exopolysaccharide biosynthesis
VNEIYAILFKHGRLIIGTFLMTVTTVALGTYLTPPVYESHATLLVKFGREYVYLPTVTDEKGPSNYYNREGIINNEIEIISSQDLLEQTIATIGVADLYPDLAANPPKHKPLIKVAEKEFRTNLSFQGGKDMDILKVSFRNENPKIAAKTINVLIDLFRDKHLRTFSSGENGSTVFLEKKVAEYQTELAAAEEALKSFRESHSAFSINEQQTILLKQQGALEAALQDAENQLAGLRGRLASLNLDASRTKKNTHLRTEAGKNFNDITDKAKEQLLALELKEKDLARSFNNDNRLLVSTQNQIELVKQFIQGQQKSQEPRVVTGANEIYQELHKNLILTRADIEMQTARSIALREQLRAVNGSLKTMLGYERELRELDRDASVKQENYRAYRNKLEGLRLSNEMDRSKLSNISVVQAAVVPIKPIRPIKILNLALGVVFGLIAGISMALIREYISQHITTPESAAKRLGFPVLATIDYEEAGFVPIAGWLKMMRKMASTIDIQR